MRFEARLQILEQLVCHEEENEIQTNAHQTKWRARVLASLQRVPEEFQIPMAELLRSRSSRWESIDEWLESPFHPCAPAIRDDFRFPSELIAFLMNPPRDYWIGHTCERCGLHVPVFMPARDHQTAPQKLSAFPVCPACGGMTKYGAEFQTAVD